MSSGTNLRLQHLNFTRPAGRAHGWGRQAGTSKGRELQLRSSAVLWMSCPAGARLKRPKTCRGRLSVFNVTKRKGGKEHRQRTRPRPCRESERPSRRLMSQPPGCAGNRVLTGTSWLHQHKMETSFRSHAPVSGEILKFTESKLFAAHRQQLCVSAPCFACCLPPYLGRGHDC